MSWTALVTGATGLVGRHLVARLLGEGWHVRALARRPEVAEWPSAVTPITGDIRARAAVATAMKGCQAVFHCAAELRDPLQMWAVNVGGTANVSALARAVGVEYFCYLSSVGVIGRTDQVVVDEGTSCAPVNPYEATKLEAEQIVVAGIPGLRTVVLRPTNVFGPASAVAAGDDIRGRIKLWLTGRERAHLVYVGDVVEAAIFLHAGGANAGKIFIVSSDEEPGTTRLEIENRLRAFQGRAPMRLPPVPPVFVAHRLRLLAGRPVNRGDVCFSSRRLRAAGFTPRYGIHEGLRLVASRTCHLQTTCGVYGRTRPTGRWGSRS